MLGPEWDEPPLQQHRADAERFIHNTWLVVNSYNLQIDARRREVASRVAIMTQAMLGFYERVGRLNGTVVEPPNLRYYGYFRARVSRQRPCPCGHGTYAKVYRWRHTGGGYWRTN